MVQKQPARNHARINARPTAITARAARDIATAIGRGTASLNARDLAADLNQAFIGYWIRWSLKSARAVTKSANTLEEIIRHSRHVEQLLTRTDIFAVEHMRRNAEEAIRTSHRSRPTLTGANLKEPLPKRAEPAELAASIETLKAIAEGAELTRRWLKSVAPLQGQHLSPFQQLISEELPQISRSHLGIEPSVAQGGPYVKFVAAALAAADLHHQKGSHYSASGIVSALSRVRRLAKQRTLNKRPRQGRRASPLGDLWQFD